VKGIYDMFAYAEEADQMTNNALPIMRLSLLSVVSIAVGITNLLPIPALDGGQILFLLIEAVTRKKIPERLANIINTVFFFLLIALMIFITFRDFINPIVLH
ncbi:MAG TPA: site-2 protease family protein, partial [Anaerolineaceae bacterium]|nr:site-2 protease family protein [Anaerolineaceae bacterium]